jgi:hypothetical protein
MTGVFKGRMWLKRGTENGTERKTEWNWIILAVLECIYLLLYFLIQRVWWQYVHTVRNIGIGGISKVCTSGEGCLTFQKKNLYYFTKTSFFTFFLFYEIVIRGGGRGDLAYIKYQYKKHNKKNNTSLNSSQESIIRKNESKFTNFLE